MIEMQSWKTVSPAGTPATARLTHSLSHVRMGNRFRAYAFSSPLPLGEEQGEGGVPRRNLQPADVFVVGRPPSPLPSPRGSVLPVLAIIALFLGGCANSPSPRAELVGPAQQTTIRFEPWTNSVKPARIIHTPNYRIFTTIQDDEFLRKLATILQGAFDQYQRMCPGVPVSRDQMDCYIFATRSEWEAFTREHTGADAKIYLQINRGGYTIRDWFVSYYLAPTSTFAVASHEGWHQFVSRNFKDRLPPFMEEGIATQFENITWTNHDLPRWNLKRNANRALRLRQAIEGKYLRPLNELCTMHAGDVVGQGFEKIESFYAQNWAFIRFLHEYENGKYRAAFEKLIADTAAGRLYDSRPTRRAGFNPHAVVPLLERYLGASLTQVNDEYVQFVKQIAFDRFDQQWGG